jgi:hypothetical protein
LCAIMTRRIVYGASIWLTVAGLWQPNHSDEDSDI